jgi:hypothetical protein
MKPRVLVVCGDPGGAMAVCPVIKQLQEEERVSVIPLAYNEAAVIWRDAGISQTVIPNDYPEREMINLIENNGVSLLFTGTSVNTFDLEKQFISIAAEFEIPSLSLLDFWTNYTWRFSDDQGNLDYMPDKIAVMDQYAFDEMVREGFDPESLVITGQPVFDDLAEWQNSFSPARSKEIRMSLGLEADEYFVLFASQPLTSLYGTDILEERYLGFDEWTVLELLIDSLERIKEETAANIHLVIRPHPRESAEMFQGFNSDLIPISVVHGGTARSQVMAADLVIGMNTELLVEACYLGCIAVSLQPGLRHPDRLPTNRLGFSRAVYDPMEIVPVIHELLLDENARNQMKENVKDFRLAGKATGNVVRLLYEMIQFD